MLDPIKLGSSTFKTHNGQKCHVGYIRLSDWSKFEIRRSDWLAPNRCHILLSFGLADMFANLSHVSRYEFINTNKLVKKFARIEASSICRQQFANLFADCFCAVHTHQLEFANFSLSFEGRFSNSYKTKKLHKFLHRGKL